MAGAVVLTCRVATGFVFHDLDFSRIAGLSLMCRRCETPISMDRFLAEPCAGTRCQCGHSEAAHRHLEDCREDGCLCKVFIPNEETTP